MNTVKTISVVAIAYVAIFLGMWGFLEFKNMNDSTVALTLYSDYEFEQNLLQKEISENLYIVQLDENTINEYPVLIELIKENQSKEKPINARGSATATYEEIKDEIGYFASKFTEKYSGSLPSDIYRELKKDNGWHSITLKEQYFYYDGNLYMVDPPIIVISEGEPEIRIQKIKQDYDLKGSLTVYLTETDLQNMPRFKEAFLQIGAYEKNVQSRKEMTESEFRKYEKWAMDSGLADEKVVFDYGFIKHQDRYYHLYLRP